MNISARNKQLLQRGLTMTIIVGGALYSCFRLLINPMLQVHAQELSQLQSCTDKIKGAQVGLRDLAVVSNEVFRLQAELGVATNRFVIRPVLGSTLVNVQGFVEPIAAACGLQIESWTERGRTAIPVEAKEAGIVLERYALEIGASGSYAAVRDFLQALEKANPYVCVTEIDMQGRPENPAIHRVRICAEWPVFGERKETPPENKPAAPGGKRP